MEVRFSHRQKASLSIDVRFDLISTVFKLVHPRNAIEPITETLDGIVMDSNDTHLVNEPNPTDKREDGKLIDVRL